MIKTLKIILALTFLLPAALASASLVTIDSTTPNVGWNYWDTSILNTPGKFAYWNNRTSDASRSNIGFYLTGTGAFGPGGAYYDQRPIPTPGNIPFWGIDTGTNTGAADPRFYVNSQTKSDVVLKLELASWRNYNSFGYYFDVSDVAHSQVTLFDALDNPGETAVINYLPNTEFGFFFVAKDGKKYFTNSGFNSNTVRSEQHFALFAETSGSYWVAVEDTGFRYGSDRDYNDFVVKITPMQIFAPPPTPVPEAGVGVLFLTGLSGIIAYRRWKRFL